MLTAYRIRNHEIKNIYVEMFCNQEYNMSISILLREVNAMKKKLLAVLCILLALLTLSACGKKKNNAETVTVAPAETSAPAQPAATQEAAPAATPSGGFAITPTQAPDAATPAPTPVPTPAPTLAPAPTQAAKPTPTAAPANSKLPVVKKDPTGETVNVGGKCQFVTRYENAKWAVWHFVSPDGSRDIDYLKAAEEFPTLKIIDGYGKDMTLDKIPAELNGWKVYCRFSNDSGSTDTASALITVKGAGTGSGSSPAPSNPNAPVITKDPGSEIVAAGGKCQFVTRYENAKIAEWHFVSPDGTKDLDYLQAGKEFPTLKIIKGYSKDMTLDNIPVELNGWKVYCRFSNDSGSTDTKTALITIKGQPTPTPAPTSAPKRQGFEGRWAEEIAGRCQINFTYRDEGSMNVDIAWSSSAWQRARWTMTANVSKKDIMEYTDGHYWVENYTDDSHYTVSDESYNGTGRFFIQDGKLHWVDDQTGQETVCKPA